MSENLESITKFINVLAPKMMSLTVMSNIFNDDENRQWANQPSNILAWGIREYYEQHYMACIMMDWAKERIQSGYYKAAREYLTQCQSHLSNAQKMEQDKADFCEDYLSIKPSYNRYHKFK